LQRLTGLAAGTVDQTGRQSFRIVEQDFEEVFGRELLVALTQGQRLGGLHEPAGAVSELLEIHFLAPSAHDGTRNMTGPFSAARLKHYVGAIIAV
jgi:hypothetical protein